MLLEADTRRRTRAVTTVSYGPAEAGDRSFCPRPTISKLRLIQIGVTKGWGDKFILIASFSWTLLLKIPPERREGEGRRGFTCREPPRKKGGDWISLPQAFREA